MEKWHVEAAEDVVVERVREVSHADGPRAAHELERDRLSSCILNWNYAKSLYTDADATVDDVREAVTTLEETERIARRVLGGVHPLTEGIEKSLRKSRAVLAAREGDPSARTMLCEALKAM